MIWLVQWLWRGHAHKWKILSVHELSMIDSGRMGRRFVLQCEKCGNLKKFDTLD